MAATRALASLAREDVPEAVAAAYGGERMRFGPDYIIPTPFDPRVLLSVAPAVARAAMRTGVARKELDLESYRSELEARLGPGREFMRGVMDRAKLSPQRIVLPEGEQGRIVRSTSIIRDEGLGTPVLVGDEETVREVARAENVDLEGVEIHDPRDPGEEERRDRFTEELWKSRRRKGVTREEALRLTGKPLYFGAMMVASGEADVLVAGVDKYYPDALRPLLRTIGVEPGVNRVAGLYIMVSSDRLYFLADATVDPEPGPEELAEIAITAGDFASRFGISPRIAMISFSDFGSVQHPAATRVREAVSIVKEHRPDLVVDGEMQADTALDERKLREVYPFSDLREAANVLVLPNLDAANAAYKLLSRLGDSEAIGPVLLGMARPAHILQRGASVADIANLAAIAAVDAVARKGGEVHLEGGRGV